MFNIYYNNRVLQNSLKPALLYKLKTGLKRLSTLAIITISCTAIANNADNDMRADSESALEVIHVIGNKVTVISESGRRLGLSLKEVLVSIDIISGEAKRWILWRRKSR